MGQPGRYQASRDTSSAIDSANIAFQTGSTGNKTSSGTSDLIQTITNDLSTDDISYNQNNQVTSNTTEENKAASQISASKNYSETSTRKTTGISSISGPAGVRFAVQIAASRVPLTRAQLWAIFPGNFTVEVVPEGKWFKYRITGFNLFSDAERVANELSIGDAWVLATRNGEVINLVTAREATRDMESDLPGNAYSGKEARIDYYVQLAASRVRIPQEEITGYCLTDKYREIIEQGWFKYQIYAGESYNDAVKLRSSLHCRSFIVGYRGGQRINYQPYIIQERVGYFQPKTNQDYKFSTRIGEIVKYHEGFFKEFNNKID